MMLLLSANGCHLRRDLRATCQARLNGSTALGDLMGGHTPGAMKSLISHGPAMVCQTDNLHQWGRFRQGKVLSEPSTKQVMFGNGASISGIPELTLDEVVIIQ